MKLLLMLERHCLVTKGLLSLFFVVFLDYEYFGDFEIHVPFFYFFLFLYFCLDIDCLVSLGFDILACYQKARLCRHVFHGKILKIVEVFSILIVE